jgi:hypothetical protein
MLGWNWRLPIDDPEIYKFPMDEETRHRIEQAQKLEGRQTLLLGLAVWILTSLVQVGMLLAAAT